jgi:hypothetical protein
LFSLSPTSASKAANLSFTPCNPSEVATEAVTNLKPPLPLFKLALYSMLEITLPVPSFENKLVPANFAHSCTSAAFALAHSNCWNVCTPSPTLKRI